MVLRTGRVGMHKRGWRWGGGREKWRRRGHSYPFVSIIGLEMAADGSPADDGAPLVAHLGTLGRRPGHALSVLHLLLQHTGPVLIVTT